MTNPVDTLNTDALIAHILDRFHAAHRAEVPGLIALAVMAARADERFPRALIDALHEAERELESHMQKEEQILFPLMEAGGHPMIGCPINQMRYEHDEHAGRIAALETLTDHLRLPANAGEAWTALYAGIGKLLGDLREHIRLENEVLFPRFAAEEHVEDQAA